MDRLRIIKEVRRASGCVEISEGDLVDVKLQGDDGAILLEHPDAHGWPRAFALQPRTDGEFAGKAIFLSSSFNWTLGRDDEGCTILVPTAKCMVDV